MIAMRHFGLPGMAALMIMLCGPRDLDACTGLYTRTNHGVLVGNNEDGANPETKVWFVPGKGKTYGRMCVGYNDLSAQGGVNEKGLWFDAFGLPSREVARPSRHLSGRFAGQTFGRMSDVDDVLGMLRRYSRTQMTRYQWMFGDRMGNSVIIEADTTLPIRGGYQIITNFRQSQFPSGNGYECERYRIASKMLAETRDPRLEDVRRVLDATHSEGGGHAYSYIADLTKGLVYLYHFHNFENVVVLDIRKELAKGEHVYNLPDLFPRTNAAASFEYRARFALSAKKSARRDTTFVAATYPDSADVLLSIRRRSSLTKRSPSPPGLNSSISSSTTEENWKSCRTRRLHSSFLNYGGMDFSCRFPRDSTNHVRAMILEGGGLQSRHHSYGDPGEPARVLDMLRGKGQFPFPYAH